MNHISQVTSPSPSPPPPPSVLVLMLHALVFVLVMQPGSVVHAAELHTDNAGGSNDWVPPVVGATHSDVLEPFVPPEMPWSSAHRVLAIRATSQQIVSPAGGEVTVRGTTIY